MNGFAAISTCFAIAAGLRANWSAGETRPNGGLPRKHSNSGLRTRTTKNGWADGPDPWERERREALIPRRIDVEIGQETRDRAALSRPAAAEVCPVVHAEAGGDVAQAGSAGGEEAAEQAAALSFSSRACQLSAVPPSRLRTPVSSDEITALPSRKSRQL